MVFKINTLSLLGNQFIYCNVCGERFETNFKRFDGRVCNHNCWKELGILNAKALILNPIEKVNKNDN